MFAIIEGLPYLVRKGMAIPVKIETNGDYTYDVKQSFRTDVKGIYGIPEILAKCEKLSSIKPKRQRKTSG